MRTLRILGVTISVLALSASSCDEIATSLSDARPSQQIFISMDYSAPFDARPGDTVNIIMEPDAANPQGYCDVHGGSLWMNPATDILICEDVDF